MKTALLLLLFLPGLAVAQPAQQGGGLEGLFMLIVLMVVMYFFMIRPQMKRQKEHKNMVAALNKGDEVVTDGGVYGKLTKVGESAVDLEIADKITIKVRKASVSTVLPKGTLKEL